MSAATSVAADVRVLLQNGRLDLPFPAGGKTDSRHQMLAEIAREDLAVARLAEAHVDALAILHEAGKEPHPGCLYGVWASEAPGSSLAIVNQQLSGSKMFCSGATIADRALITVTKPEQLLVDIDLHKRAHGLTFDDTAWVTSAFAGTHTATAKFDRIPVAAGDVVGPAGWYLSRPGFWHGACGPASCWAGGGLALVDYAVEQTRDTNPHALAHVGAMMAIAWQLKGLLQAAGREIDADPFDTGSAQIRALTLRHLVEQSCTEILQRFGRALGPRPLAFDRRTARLHQELALYIRQSHAEADLEALARRSLARLRTS